MTLEPVPPTLPGVIDGLRRRVDSLERAPSTPPRQLRTSLTVTAFPSPPWRPPAAMTLDEIWVDTDSPVSGDATFTVSRNGSTIGTATVSSGESRVAARLSSPVSVDVHDVVTVTADDTGAAQATVQVLGTSQHPITPSLGGGQFAPTARARITSTTTTIPADDAALVEWDHVDFELGGATVDSGTRITLPVSGIYQADAQVLFGWSGTQASLSDAAGSQVWSGTEDDTLEFDAGDGGTFFTVNTGGGAGGIVAGFDGTVSITGSATFNDNTSDGTFELVIQVDGSDAATSDTYDLTDSASTFTLGASVTIDIANGSEITLLGRSQGMTSGSVSLTGVDEHTLVATRVDIPTGPEVAIVQKSSDDSALDVVAVSDTLDRRGLASTMAFQATEGDYLEVWAYNPQPDDVVTGTPLTGLADSIHSWVDSNFGTPIYSEFRLAWVGPGSGDRPGGGG